MNKQGIRILGGIYLLLMGSAILVSNLGISGLGHFFSNWWPTYIFIALGLYFLLNNPRRNYTAYLVLVFGILLQLREFDILHFSVFSLFWPAVLITIGISILLRPNSKELKEKSVNLTAIFGGNEKKITSKDFKSGNLTAIFGGIKLDLSKAEFAGKEASLEIITAFGGTDIIISPNTEVISNGIPLFGGIDIKASTDKPIQKLIINANVIFGGIDIKN